MKKIRWMLLLITIVLAGMLAACAGNTAQDSTAAGQSEATSAETQSAAESAVVGAFSEADLVFVMDGVSYPLDTDAAPLLEAFGPDYEMTAATSCRYVGEDKMFIYDFATVYTYPIDGKDMIDEIYIQDGDYTTAKDIGIGSTLDEVKAAYGEGGFDIDGAYTYLVSGDPNNKKCAQLYFEVMDDEVVAFGYYAASNVAND